MDGLFLVLEPGNHMYLVIEAASRMGCTVVVCHSQPVAPPAPFDRALPSVSHFVPVKGWRDGQGAFEAIVAWCGDRPVRGTYAGYETTLRTQARLRQHFGLPVSSYSTRSSVGSLGACASLGNFCVKRWSAPLAATRHRADRHRSPAPRSS